ncbi:ribosome maturation factor RimM [Mesorhizobium sp. YC-39]|uniref:ribosome maturation factor RimM n=1 Tax=unclassified Mesorhizobium TaxID=325217 RepID=UPI0021E971CE|nr:MULTISPECIES: ribosome maturation factor RimM [unclassified Mesorhizobium]MCV3208240.1 ribosome maturation factor RimM [Mesorhizobium sp. YC-2]MCV3229967.1 ribosome maturation factor RimM [Mesorhizobium sp. YC-39]
MSKPQNPVQMAVIGAAHGIKGELRVKTFTGEPLALADYGPLYAKDGRAFQIIDIRPANTVVVVRFRGVNDRNAAEALAGTELFVDRSMLPDDGEEDEFYHADLVGLEVRDDSGVIGKVVAVHNFGGGDILDVTLGGRKGVLIPFTQAAVPDVSITEGFIRVDPAAAGLVDDEDSEAPGREGFDPKGRPRGPRDAGGNR